MTRARLLWALGCYLAAPDRAPILGYQSQLLLPARFHFQTRRWRVGFLD